MLQARCKKPSINKEFTPIELLIAIIAIPQRLLPKIRVHLGPSVVKKEVFSCKSSIDNFHSPA